MHMETFVLLLRGINVGGNRKIKMADLKQLLSDHSFENIQTYIQSGNVLCQHKQQKKSELKHQTEIILEKTYGFHVEVLVLKRDDLKQIIRNNPFVEKQIPIEKLYCTLLDKPADLVAQEKLLQFQNEDERFTFGQNVIYCCYHKGYGKAKTTNAIIEKKLSITATTRNWKTMTKLGTMLT